MVRKRMGGVVGGVMYFGGGKDLGGGNVCNSFVYLGMLNASADFRLFLGIYYDWNDGNIYIEYHMDFLRNHAHLAGGDTRKAPNLANHGKHQEDKTPPTPTPLNPPNHGISRQTYGRQDPPPRHSLQINQITPNPLNPFQPKYP